MNSSIELNLEFLFEITNGNKEKLNLIIKSFLEEAPLACEKMRELLLTKSYSKIKSEAHSSKPLFLSVGASSAINSIENIENYCTSSLFYELLPIEISQLNQQTIEICTILKVKFDI